ncbi:Zinc finger, CCCH-type [Dillenia turbinata]|uniref:Zinc finger, CCCH-type n=1 Tax=Dillenia turbinata TaxID=194707 RepID=A0AAN8VTX5_9MAGN
MTLSETMETLIASDADPQQNNYFDQSHRTAEETSPPVDDATNSRDSFEKPENSEIETPAPMDEKTDGSELGEKRKREEREEQEEKKRHPLWKTSLCSYFRRSNGNCSHGEACRYAHSEEELRIRPDNTWDPTSERAKKLLKSENGENKKVLEGEERMEEKDILMTDVLADSESGDRALNKCLVHLPMKWGSDQLRNFLSEQGISFKTAKKKKGMTVGFVSFENVEQMRAAAEELDGKSIGEKNIKFADVIPRTFEEKNKPAAPVPQGTVSALTNDNGEDGLDYTETANHEPEVGGSVSKTRSAREVVTPLAHMSYADQLEHKKNSLIQLLKKLTRNARKACPNGISLPEWIINSREIGGLPCKLEGIIESPLINGYRNKCEFSVGLSVQGKPTVGFMLGNFREGVTAVEEPTDCPNVSQIACKYASIFQEFLQSSGLPVWNRFSNTGFWRQLTVREGRAPVKAAENENMEANISEVMLIIQDHKGISNVAPSDAPLRPLAIQKAELEAAKEVILDAEEPRLRDYINNLQFCISPTAFFQVNTLAAEKLYTLAGDWADLGPDTLLFDICCGTGTIGLTLAHRVGMVVGIEMNASAVSDAQRNAEINGINNCRFVCGKAEDVMGPLLKEFLGVPGKQEEDSSVSESHEIEKIDTEVKNYSTENSLEPEEGVRHEDSKGRPSGSANGILEMESPSPILKHCNSEDGNSSTKQFKNVVAIVDPPRAGLHPIVTKALRTHSRLRRLVYISCNPESLVANAIELCTPSNEKSEKGNKNNRGWRNMSSAGLARHRVKSMPISEPFRPVKAMAVDLFPHTPHCELVMLLER